MIAPRRLFRLSPFLLIFAGSPILGGTVAVEVRDSSGKAVEDAVVYAIPEGGAPPAAKRTAVMDQKDRMFIPHVLAIQTGTAVEFPNSDDVRHHVYSFSTPKPFQLPLYKGTPANPIVFDKAGVVALGCNIHDRMSAFIVIVDTPYFAKTNPKGLGELVELPPDRYVVRVWFDAMESEPQPAHITIGGDERHHVKFAPGEIKAGSGGP